MLMKKINMSIDQWNVDTVAGLFSNDMQLSSPESHPLQGCFYLFTLIIIHSRIVFLLRESVFLKQAVLNKNCGTWARFNSQSWRGEHFQTVYVVGTYLA